MLRQASFSMGTRSWSLYSSRFTAAANQLILSRNSFKFVSNCFATATNASNIKIASAHTAKSKFSAASNLPSVSPPSDHRVIGQKQALFYFSGYSPGSAFFLPHGTIIYNNLLNYLRREYNSRGYDEVRSPLIYDWRLFLRSGHWDAYRDNMFLVQSGQNEAEVNLAEQKVDETGESITDQEVGLIEKEAAKQTLESASCAHITHTESNLSSGFDGHEAGKALYGIKPMNCPGHCLLFAMKKRSYRELPLRFADFSDLHRNEVSGALTGLTRVRRFAQDDAHIFCSHAQIGQEIENCLNFVQNTYKMFGFEWKLKLSTRPREFIGDINVWNSAENELKALLQRGNYSYELNEGDGAFYGPKIDISIADRQGKLHQCATIQLDFQLPQRFQLKYVTSEGNFAQPVIIHRAILGSLERMIAILTENYAGKWPLWLSPRQIKIITISDKEIHVGTAQALRGRLKAALDQFNYSFNLYVDVDSEVLSIGKKIRTAQLLGYNYSIVIGDTEATDPTQLTVRIRDSKEMTKISLDKFIELIQQEIREKSLKSPLLAM
jgi:threonyl-tRNA synthetase